MQHKVFQSNEKATFIADSMLGDVARWLRLLGFDCIYNTSLNDDDLLQIALKDQRILLTRDRVLHRRALLSGVKSLYFEATDIVEVLKQISKELQLHLNFDEKASRCPTCNSPLRRASKDEVSRKVPEGVLKRYDKFWVCSNAACGKVYWIGSHWKTIKKVLSSLNQKSKQDK